MFVLLSRHVHSCLKDRNDFGYVADKEDNFDKHRHEIHRDNIMWEVLNDNSFRKKRSLLEKTEKYLK